MRRGLPVFSPNQSFELLGYRPIPLTHYDVEHGLGANDLRGRCNQWRIAGIFSDAGYFFQYFGELVGLTCLLHLGNQIGEHAAGNLIHQSIYVHFQHFGIQQTAFDVLIAQRREVFAHFIQFAYMQTGIIGRAGQGSHKGFCGRLGSTHSKRRNGGIHDIHAGFDSFQNSHRSQTGGIVGMQLNGNGNGFLQGLDQFKGIIRLQ